MPDHGDGNHGREAERQFVEPECQPPAVFQPADHSFDDVSATVGLLVQLRFGAFHAAFFSFRQGPCRDGRLDSPAAAIPSDCLGVVPLVRDDHGRPVPRPPGSRGDLHTPHHGLEIGSVARLRTAQNSSQWSAP
jgi:hypothetical protein